MFENQKAKSFVVFSMLTIFFVATICVSFGNVKAQSTQCKISGYVLDSNGRGIAGAHVIFNVPSLIPGVMTDSSGYYQTSGSSGTYHMNVWPPFDSSYISYDKPVVVISSDSTINVTLNTGYKVSGYITDSSGVPVVGACVFLSGNGSGWFSTSAGYYFVAIPTGNYTINAHPRTDSYSSSATQFPAYYEYNFTVNGDTIKNIVVGSTLTPTPTPTSAPDGTRFKISGYVTDSNGKGLANAQVIFNVPLTVPAVYSDATGYYEMSAPAGTYHVNVWPPFDSNYLSYDQPQLVVSTNISKNITLASGFKVYGYISDYSGNPVSKAIVILSGQTSGWFSKSDGYYTLAVPAGTYKIDVHPGTDGNKNPLANFPTYYEYNFTVAADTLKNIVVGMPSTTSPTPTPLPVATPPKTVSPISPVSPTPLPTMQPANSPNLYQNNVKTTDPTFAVSLPKNQPNENSLEYWVLLISITIASVAALMTIVWVYRGKQAVIQATR